MAQVCPRCRCVNPVEATYCYNDGNVLGHRADVPADGGSINIGAQPFPRPFVFPSGRACHNFDQFLLACQEGPADAYDLLRQGHLATFFANLGRADLASAALAASRATDRERGFDEFLGRLPTAGLLAPARLKIEPPILELRGLPPGKDRRCELILRNDGKRLLFGSASCEDCRWLSLGDGPEQKRKVFQFPDQMVLPVHLLGRRLRAFHKPQEAEVRFESNGGAVAVLVRVEVTVQPFPDGAPAGALSPRQLAERIRAAPRESAALIENGAVARWYKANGWAYPVLGPTATGLAAVQQLFEALGLVRTPPVELSEDSVQLSGSPGQAIDHVLAVITQTNRSAVAHGTSDQPWLQVGATIFRGRSAILPLSVAAVPACPGETLRAQVKVVANGGQRFVVPVTLTVSAAPQRSIAPTLLETGPPAGTPVPPTVVPRPPTARRRRN
jgi:hypothetical protein